MSTTVLQPGAIPEGMAVMSNHVINSKNKVHQKVDKKEDSKVEIVPNVAQKIVPNVEKVETIEQLRAKYKEAHPEGKNVPPAWINNAEKIKEKIQEFTK